MDWEYLSGIGYIDPEKAAIITENGEELRLYRCKFILILNDVLINGNNEEGKCLYIPIDKEDTGFRNDNRGNHVEYLKHALIKYKFGDGNNSIHDFFEKVRSEDSVDYNEWIIPLTEMGICIYSNLSYEMKEPIFKKGGLFLPENHKIISESQKEQIKNLVPILKKELFVQTLIWDYDITTDGEKELHPLGESGIDDFVTTVQNICDNNIQNGDSENGDSKNPDSER